MTPAGTSNELDVQNEWEENTQHTYYPDGVFLPCDHGLDFDISLLCENLINRSSFFGLATNNNTLNVRNNNQGKTSKEAQEGKYYTEVV